MKKILTIIITVVIFTMQLPIYAKSGTEDISEEKIGFLKDLGIISSYNSDANISLSEFAAAIDTVTDTENRAQQYFSDSRLAENKPVKYSELLPVLIDLCGYTPYFNLKYNGINEASCIKLAAEIGITGGKTIKFNDNVTGKDYAEMLYNTLFTEVLQSKTDGKSTSYKTEAGKNVLYTESNLYEVKGIADGAGMTVLNGGLWDTDDASYKMMSIGGVSYWCASDYDSDGIVGRYVKAYVSRDDDEIHAVIVPEDMNNVIKVESEDMLKAPSEKDMSFAYYDQSGKVKNAKLSYNADIVYNGRTVTVFDDTLFTSNEAEITFIDNNRDNTYEAALINKYDSFVVQTAGSDCEKVVDTNGKQYDFEEYFRAGNSIYDSSGKKVERDNVLSKNVLSVRYDRNGKATKMILNNKTVKGTVNSIRDNMKYITVDENEYRLDENYRTSDAIKNVTAGTEITGYLNFKGKIAEIEIYNSVWQYAWAFSGYNGNGYEAANMRILDEDGKYGYVYLKDKVTLDGVKCTSEKCMDNAVFKDTDGAFKKQLVKIKRNANGEITAIDTAKMNHGLGVRSDGTEFELNFDCEQGYSSDGTSKGTIIKSFRIVSTDGKKWFGAKYVADSSSPLFLINSERPERSIVRLAGNIETGNEAKVNLYDVDKDYVPGAIVRFMTDTASTAYIDPYRASYLVKNICEAVNDDNETVIRVYCYYQNELQYFDFEDTELRTYSYNNLTGDSRLTGVKLRDIKPGSIISVRTDLSTNNGIAYALRFMPMEDNSEVIYESGDTNGSWDYGVTTGMWNANGLFAYGPVYGKTKYGVITNYHDETAHMWDRHVIFGNTTGVYIFNRANNRVEIGSWLDIDVGDMLFVHKLKGNYVNVVVYK